mgnify:FL=1
MKSSSLKIAFTDLCPKLGALLALFVFALAFSGLLAPDAMAAVSMTNVETQTGLVKTWLQGGGLLVIAACILAACVYAYNRSPFAGVALIILTVICGTLFTAALTV